MSDITRPLEATFPETRRGFAFNIAVLRARLRRSRVPWSTVGLNRSVRIVGAGAAITVILIVASVLAIDFGSVGWATGLPPAVHTVFGTITRYGKSDWILIPTAIFGVIILFGNWTLVERRIAAAWAEIGSLVLYFFVAVAGAGLTNNLIKLLVGRSRPWRFDTDGILTFTPFALDAAHYSFPSGHATTITAAAVALVLMMRRFRVIALLLLAGCAAIAVSRVVVGSHFPSDVVGGIFVGAAFTYALAFTLGRTGVAFQRLEHGGLLPKTVAIRRVFRQSPSVGALSHGLALALSRPPPGVASRPG